MDKEVLVWLLGGISTIAWTYFMLDRKSMATRITRKGEQIDTLKTEATLMKIEITTIKSQLLANQETEKLRTDLLKQSLANMEKNVTEIKGDMKMLMETILKSLIKNGN